MQVSLAQLNNCVKFKVVKNLLSNVNHSTLFPVPLINLHEGLQSHARLSKMTSYRSFHIFYFENFRFELDYNFLVLKSRELRSQSETINNSVYCYH